MIKFDPLCIVALTIMYADRGLGVRHHQLWVLASLQLATKPVTPAEISELLNSRREETQLPPTDPNEVEASLAALMLRPTLQDFISVSTRRATVSEARRRRRIGLGPLSGLVILSACSTTPAVRDPLPPIRTVHTYFGNALPLPKAESSLSRPVFTGVAFADAYERATSIVDQSPESFTSKTLEPAPPAAYAYFDDSPSSRAYTARKEAELAPTVLAAASPPPPPPSAPSLMVAVPVEPIQLISLSFSPNEASAPVSSSVYSLAERVRERAQKSPAISQPALVRTLPPSESMSAPLPPPATPSAKAFKLDFGDVERPDLYSDLITFGNSSIRLEAAALRRIQALVSAAKDAEAIQLRGRFGNRNLDDSMARTALARAIAVRAALVAQGVPQSKIRIHMPRHSDLLVPTDPMHESNRSVSVFMVVPEHRAAALGLHPGKPIASTTVTSAAAS
jgi:hypothetical protein